MRPTAPPAALPWTRVTTNCGARIMARITPAKPLKNCWPCAGSESDASSSNDAPAQNGPVPPLCNTITRTAGSWLTRVTVAASSRSRTPGSELLLGWKNSMRPMPLAMSVWT